MVGKVAGSKRAGVGKAGPEAAQIGVRGRLGESFMAVLAADFEAHGKATIEALRSDKPQDYLKVVASILPKELSGVDGAPIVAEIRRTLVRPGN